MIRPRKLSRLCIIRKKKILIAEKLSDIGVIPKIAAKEIRKKAKFNVEEINELEKQTRHDVNAYIDNVSKYIGKQSKFFSSWCNFK